MPTDRTPPTRHSLLRTNAELDIARRGLDVLEGRQQRLVVLLRELLERWQTQSEALDEAFERARETRIEAVEREGIIALDSAGHARKGHAEVLYETRSLQGLPVPFFISSGITKRIDERGYGVLGTSAATDETAATHEEVLERVVRQAELALTLRILTAEIGRLTVRVNALRHKVIPQLEERKRYIELHLEEREREERTMQRFLKRKRDSRADTAEDA